MDVTLTASAALAAARFFPLPFVDCLETWASGSEVERQSALCLDVGGTRGRGVKTDPVAL